MPYPMQQRKMHSSFDGQNGGICRPLAAAGSRCGQAQAVEVGAAVLQLEKPPGGGGEGADVGGLGEDGPVSYTHLSTTRPPWIPGRRWSASFNWTMAPKTPPNFPGCGLCGTRCARTRWKSWESSPKPAGKVPGLFRRTPASKKILQRVLTKPNIRI